MRRVRIDKRLLNELFSTGSIIPAQKVVDGIDPKWVLERAYMEHHHLVLEFLESDEVAETLVITTETI